MILKSTSGEESRAEQDEEEFWAGALGKHLAEMPKGNPHMPTHLPHLGSSTQASPRQLQVRTPSRHSDLLPGIGVLCVGFLHLSQVKASAPALSFP